MEKFQKHKTRSTICQWQSLEIAKKGITIVLKLKEKNDIDFGELCFSISHFPKRVPVGWVKLVLYIQFFWKCQWENDKSNYGKFCKFSQTFRITKNPLNHFQIKLRIQMTFIQKPQCWNCDFNFVNVLNDWIA